MFRKAAISPYLALPSPPFLLEPLKLPLSARLELQAETEADYSLASKYAEELVDRLFLQQVRVTNPGQLLTLSLTEGTLRLLVRSASAGIVGIDSELEILPAVSSTCKASPRVAALPDSTLAFQGSISEKLVPPANRFKWRTDEFAAIELTCSMLNDHGDLAERSFFVTALLKGQGLRLRPEFFQQTKLLPWLPVKASAVAESAAASEAEVYTVCDISLLDFHGLILPSNQSCLVADGCWLTIRGSTPFARFDRSLTRLRTTEEAPFLTQQVAIKEESDGLAETIKKHSEMVPSPGLLVCGEHCSGRSLVFSQLAYQSRLPLLYFDLEAEIDALPGKSPAEKLSKSLSRLAAFTLKHAPMALVLDHAWIHFGPPLASAQDEDNRFRAMISRELVSVQRILANAGCVLILDAGEDPSELHPLISASFGLRFALGLKAKREVPKLLPAIPWEDLRGVSIVKEQLESLLLWPLLHSHIYSLNKFARPGGVLLCGPSGVGKTFLSHSFARFLQASLPALTIIPIGGPELFSKYIGASEAALRSVFAVARSRRPSLVLIDELDAMAPRRGTDASGTTDRLVNQLLTELDGTAERNGVMVLATCSRPDLLDPALLRPGRIDRRIDLRLPDSAARRDMLAGLYEGTIEAVLLEQLVEQTEGATPADLAALLLDARIYQRRTADKQGMVDHFLTALVDYKYSKLALVSNSSTNSNGSASASANVKEGEGRKIGTRVTLS